MINRTHTIDFGGRRAFVKTRAEPGAGEYATEAAGLAWLREVGALPVPEVLEVREDRLVLELVEPGGAYDEEQFGRGLAALHAAGAERFGALPPGAPGPWRVGPLAFDGEPSADWPRFYAEHRLLAVLDAAGLPASGRRAVESLCARIDELAGPPEPPARLHGDLWSGNVLAGADGRAWLIDPAAYGGHRELDLAMLALFGGPSERCFAAYDEAFPLAGGWRERVALYALFPLLVHAALFGGGYAAQAERAARAYTD